VGAHFAISSLFERYPERADIYGYEARRLAEQRFDAGRATMLVGRAEVTSRITLETAELAFGVLHFGDHNIAGGVRTARDDEAYTEMVAALTEPFQRADYAASLRALDKQFGAGTYSLESLFRDEQRRIVRRILDSTLAEADSVYRQLYEHHVPLMRYIRNLSVPLPRALHTAAEFVVSADLARALRDDPQPDKVRGLLEDARTWHIELDGAALGYALERRIAGVAEDLAARPVDRAPLELFERLVTVAGMLPFEVNLWTPQNIVYDLRQSVYPFLRSRAAQDDAEARAWVTHFRAVADALAVRTE